jgi:transcriptional regulator with XRE-family HTH domain
MLGATLPRQRKSRRARAALRGDEMDGEAIRTWLRASLASVKMSQAELGRRLGLTADQISRTLKGERTLSADEMLRAARAMGVIPPLQVPESFLNIRYVRVIGEVAAGVFSDMNVSSFGGFEIPIPVDPKWPEGTVVAYVVRGESINKRAADGDYVVTLKVEAAPRSCRDGDWIIAERVRGDLCEYTVKRVCIVNGKTSLCPESDDPKFVPYNLGQDGEYMVRVLAFVLDFVKPATKF